MNLKRIFGSKKMNHKKKRERIFLAKLICSKFVIQKSAFGQTKKTKRRDKTQTFYLYFDVLEQKKKYKKIHRQICVRAHLMKGQVKQKQKKMNETNYVLC